MYITLARQAATYVGKAALSAGVGIIVADTVNKVIRTTKDEVRMYRAYRKAKREGKPDANH